MLRSVGASVSVNTIVSANTLVQSKRKDFPAEVLHSISAEEQAS
jgi:hypothetical protein